MLEINIGATVESRGREVGRVERVVLNRDSYEATHLVVKCGSLLHPKHLLMPFGWVVGSEHDRVRIERAHLIDGRNLVLDRIRVTNAAEGSEELRSVGRLRLHGCTEAEG